MRRNVKFYRSLYIAQCSLLMTYPRSPFCLKMVEMLTCSLDNTKFPRTLNRTSSSTRAGLVEKHPRIVFNHQHRPEAAAEAQPCLIPSGTFLPPPFASFICSLTAFQSVHPKAPHRNRRLWLQVRPLV